MCIVMYAQFNIYAGTYPYLINGTTKISNSDSNEENKGIYTLIIMCRMHQLNILTMFTSCTVNRRIFFSSQLMLKLLGYIIVG